MKHVETFAILLLLATACQTKHYTDNYMAYDAVAIRQEPFDDSPVVAHVSSLMQPNSFRYDSSKPMFYLANVVGIGRPLSVLETDDTGEWGYVEVTDIQHNAAGWVRLSQMSYAGNNNPDNVTAAYIVKGKKVSLYKRPGGGALNYWLLQGDTVRVWATANGGWGHVSSYKIRQKGYEDAPRTGWVQLGQLTPMDSLSYSGVKQERKEEARQKMLEKEKLEAEEYGIGGNAAGKLIFGGFALLALLWGLLLNKTAGARDKRLELWLSMGGCAVILLVSAVLQGVPVMSKTTGLLLAVFNIVSAFCLSFVLLYPLLYVRFIARIWQFIFIIAGGYMTLRTTAGVMHPVLVLLLVAGAGWAVIKVARKLQKDVCKHCGYYAAHPVLGSSRESGETSRERMRETTTRGGETISTRDYTVIKGWVRWTTERECIRCGKEYKNVWFIRTEREES